MIHTDINATILHELEPVVEKGLADHLATIKPWHPHDFVPWSDGRNFAYLGGEDWTAEQSKLGHASRTAMFVNLLTEDNLPSYHREIATRFGRDSAWGEWVGQWTAEEARHGIALRDYLVVTRAIDPVALEEARMIHMKGGYDSGDMSPLETIAYVTLQELATRISHRNTGIEAGKDGDKLAENLLARIAKDENLHMVFYRSLGAAALEIAPNKMMRAITDQIRQFAMPGSTIPDFRKHSMTIAKAGIYDSQLHLEKVLMPTLNFWNIFNLETLSGDGAAAREELSVALVSLQKTVDRLMRRRDKTSALQED